MGLLNILKFGRKKPERVYTHLNEEELKKDEKMKAMAQALSSRDAQLAKIQAKEKERREKIDEKKKENEFNKKLQEQKEELDAHKHGKVIKLSKFYKHLLTKKKFREKLEICDKNDETVLAKFGDFGIMTGGKLCILDDKGELMSYGKTLSHILYKPDAFENMARRGRFLIPMDKDGNWLEDIEYKEIPEPLEAEFDEETGKIKRIIWSKVKTSEVKKVIGEKMEQINLLQNDLEGREGVIIKLKAKLDDLNRSLKVAESQSDTAETNLSKNLFRFTETEKRVGDMHTQITKLTEEISMYKNLIDKKDSVIDLVISKLELTGDPRSDRIREMVYDELERHKALLPERIEIKQEAPIEPRPITQPGEIIKK